MPLPHRGSPATKVEEYCAADDALRTEEEEYRTTAVETLLEEIVSSGALVLAEETDETSIPAWELAEERTEEEELELMEELEVAKEGLDSTEELE